MQSKAPTVREYLAEQTPERRRILEGVRKVILQNLDDDFEEGMQYGMICYRVPHRVYPAGYHCDPRLPLPFAGLAAQKNYFSLYIMTVYGEGEDHFRKEWAKTGKKLDMGKCCVRFLRLEDLALDVIAQAIRKNTVKKFIAHYESTIGQRRSSPARPKKAAAKKTKSSPAKKSAKAARSARQRS